jgi:repressor LexA
MLTKKQKGFLEILKKMVEQKGYFPTVREIGQRMRFSSPATVHAYLNRLYQKGKLTKQNNSWELVSDLSPVPLMGIVPAGSPLEIFEALGEEVTLPEWMLERGGDMVAFRVQGESMKDAYIREGDIVIVKRTADAENGEMVVAFLSDSSITLKRLKKEKDRYCLIPENPDYEIICEPFQLVGKVIGVLRSYR